MIHAFGTRIVSEIKEKDLKRYANKVLLIFEDTNEAEFYVDRNEYKINRALEPYQKILGKEKFNRLVEIIEEYGSVKYHEGINDGRE